LGLYQNHVAHGQTVTRELAQEALSGNLCRCTGYRPILDAAQKMAELPSVAVNELDLLQKLKQLAHSGRAQTADSSYISPPTLRELLAARASHPDAQLVAGCTDVGLWVTKQHLQFARVLDVSHVRELRCVEHEPQYLAIGAAVTLSDAFAALVQDRPQLQAFASRFAGLPVRNSGTLGGNVANGSPIGDSMPLLIALGSHVVLMSQRNGQTHHREMALEALYTGYRQTVLQADEVLAWIKVPKPGPGELCRVYKISKRFEDDISAVSLAIKLQLENTMVVQASIGVGGVAATPRAGQPDRSRPAWPGLDAGHRAVRHPRAAQRVHPPCPTCAPAPTTASRCWAICCSASGWRVRASATSIWNPSFVKEKACEQYPGQRSALPACRATTRQRQLAPS
jgi:xanthine dehydrogenase small subunit